MGSNYRCDTSRQCVKWRLEGFAIKDIVEKLRKHGITDWDYMRVKNAVRPRHNPEIAAMLCEKGELRSSPVVKAKEPEEKEGGTERKPKYERTDKGYTVYYGKNQKVSATIEEIEKAFKLYCIGGLTLNQTALELCWTRAEMFALKSAWNITKDSIPLLPETIDSMNADEIAETIRIEKKRHALQKYSHNKHADIEKEVSKLHKADYWYQEALSALKQLDPKPFQVVCRSENVDQRHVCMIADIHSGAVSNNALNKYNFDIMKARFESLARDLIEILSPCELIIADLGDKISGLIKNSLLQASENCIDSVFFLVECYSNLFLTLIKRGFSIKFYSVSGNHDAIFPNKTDRTDESSFSRIVDWALQITFKNFKQVKFVESVDNMAVIKMFDYAVLMMHGDKGRNLSRYERLFKERIVEVVAAHYHSYSATQDDNVPVFRVNSFCGSDAYATGLGLYSEPGVRLVTYSKRGRETDRLIRFDC